MSRSYKKNPVYTDRPNGAKYWKRCANKKVRRYKDNLDDGKMYRRIYNSWDIHDYINRWTKEEAIKAVQSALMVNTLLKYSSTTRVYRTHTRARLRH